MADNDIRHRLHKQGLTTMRQVARISRNEAVALINRQLAYETQKIGDAHHYGRQELRDLIDAIYGKFDETSDTPIKGPR